MKRNKFLLMATFVAMAFVSCSDDLNDDNGNLMPEVSGINVNSVTDQSVLSARVENYKGAGKTRAGMPAVFSGLTTMPDYAAVEAAATAAKVASDDNEINEWNGPDVCITAGTAANPVDVRIGASNKKVYVKGNVRVVGFWGNNVEIYILKGAKIIWAGENAGIEPGNISATQANVTYYNYGTFDAGANKLISLQGGTCLYNDADASLICNEIVVQSDKMDWSTGVGVHIPSKLYVGGSLAGINLNAQKGCVVNVCGDVDAAGINLTFDGDVRVGGLLKAKNLEVINSCHFYSECGVICSEDFTINANGSFAKLTYLKAENVYQCAGSSIKLPNKGMMDITNIYQNLNNGNDAKVELTEEGFAVIKAKELHWNAADPLTNVYLFKTPVAGQIVTDCEKYARLDNSLKPVYYELEEFHFDGATVKRIESDADRTMTIDPNTGCNENGYNPKPKENDPVVDVITDIHTHDISATCMQYFNGKTYASYHQRGAGQHGCLEVFQTVNDQTSLLQYVEDENGELDFNHLIIDPAQGTNGRLYTVGNSTKKGGIMGWIDLAANGLMNTEAKNTEAGTGLPLQILGLRAKAKGDGNCIVRNGNNYHVMSTSGFETYSTTDHSLVNFTATPGKAKHVAVGNGNIYATYLTTTAADENAEIPVEMKKFSASSTTLATADATVAAGTIQPNNGKNVVAVDPSNGNVYVCLGRDGLKCMDANGNTLWTYQPEKVQSANGNYKAFCNGVAVDANYIYVAYGTFGLRILDKNGNEKAYSKSVKSANYVSLANGYIYVAYGRERIRVYKFHPEGISSLETEY